MRTFLASTLVVSALGALAAPAFAQSATPAAGQTFAITPSSASTLTFDDQRGPYRRGGNESTGLGIRVFGTIDFESLMAKQSFDATMGSSTIFGAGGGVDVQDIHGGLMFRVAVSKLSKTGSRSDGTVSNGIALKVGMTPIDLAIGWRFNQMSHDHSIVPYVGGGLLFLHYSETTPDGVSTDNVSQSFTGYEAFGGVDIRVAHRVTLAPEVLFRSLPGAIGTGGLSQVFNETNLGGIGARVTIGYRFGR